VAQQSLYRRYRPRRFGEVRGQDHVVRALRNAVATGTETHAYLFSGPRGTGKTSTARILAKALNCDDPLDGEPCCGCEPCLAMEAGRSFDLFELDAASNNGVDAVRDLVERTAVGSPGRTKVYILDEVHMLTAAASNALLKTLEEPPEHVRFVLATTDPQKVLPTIRSRTQHFEFNLLSAAELEDYVRWVVADADLEVDDTAVAHVVRQGRGSARDTLSALDQVVAAGGVMAREEPVGRLFDALEASSAGSAIVAVADALAQGHDPRVLGEAFLGAVRDTFLLSLGVEVPNLVDADREALAARAEALGTARLTRAMERVGSALVDMRQAADPRVPLEVALVQLCAGDAGTAGATGASAASPPAGAVADLVARVERLEAASAGSAAGPGGVPSGADHRRAAQQAKAALGEMAGRKAGQAGGRAAHQGAGSGPSAEPSEPGASRSTRPRPASPRPDRPSPTPGASTAPAAPAAPAGPRSGPAEPAGAQGPGGPGPAPPPMDTTAPPDTPAPQAPTPPDTPARPAPTAGSAPSAVPAGDLPDRDAIVMAFGDVVVPRLRGIAKALYSAGRFVSVTDGTAVFALENGPTRDRAEQHRGQVEVALAEHFGTPVPLRLVTEAEAGAERGGGRGGSTSPDPASLPPTPRRRSATDAAGTDPGTASRATRSGAATALAEARAGTRRPDGDATAATRSAEAATTVGPATRAAAAADTGSPLAGRARPGEQDDADGDEDEVEILLAVDELEVARDVAASGIERLTAAFPGAELIETDEPLPGTT
jgi:DNA polymerase-3 subunit gamma/tau